MASSRSLFHMQGLAERTGESIGRIKHRIQQVIRGHFEKISQFCRKGNFCGAYSFMRAASNG